MQQQITFFGSNSQKNTVLSMRKLNPLGKNSITNLSAIFCCMRLLARQVLIRDALRERHTEKVPLFEMLANQTL